MTRAVAVLAGALAAAGCATGGPMYGAGFERSSVSRVDRKFPRPEGDRCERHRVDAVLFRQCRAARIEAVKYVQSLETSAEVCLEDTFGEPLGDGCRARGVVLDPGSTGVVIEVKEVDAARAKRFKKVENVWFSNEALADHYLAEHGY